MPDHHRRDDLAHASRMRGVTRRGYVPVMAAMIRTVDMRHLRLISQCTHQHGESCGGKPGRTSLLRRRTRVGRGRRRERPMDLREMVPAAAVTSNQ